MYNPPALERAWIEYTYPRGHSLLLSGLYSNEMLRRFQLVANNVNKRLLLCPPFFTLLEAAVAIPAAGCFKIGGKGTTFF